MAAFLPLWNKFDPSLLDEYECWHTFEHVPERVSVPGFLGARRYARGEGGERVFFTLYEIESLQVLETSAYMELVDQPSDWSARMRQYFSDFRRYPCELVASGGRGIAGKIATLILPLERASDAEQLVEPLQDQLKRCALTSFRLGLSTPRPQYKVFHQNSVGGDACAVAVVVVEATTVQQLNDVVRALGAPILRLAPKVKAEWEVFDLLCAITSEDLPQREGRRMPPRADLQASYL